VNIQDFAAIVALFPQPLLNVLVLLIGWGVYRVDRRQQVMRAEMDTTREEVLLLLRRQSRSLSRYRAA
jgi:hypothetical protein